MRPYIIVLILLTGCATVTPEQKAARLIAAYAPLCETLGYERRSEAWANCIIQQQANASHDLAARAAAFSAVTGAQAEMRRATTLQPPR